MLASCIVIIMLAYYIAPLTPWWQWTSHHHPVNRGALHLDGQRVQLARPELPAPHYICMYRLIPTTPSSPCRHYYSRLIAGTNLPTPKAGLAKADCAHITFAKVITQLNPKAPEGNEPRLLCPRPTQYQWTNRAVHYRPIINYQKKARSAVGIEPTTFRTAATDDDKD